MVEITHVLRRLSAAVAALSIVAPARAVLAARSVAPTSDVAAQGANAPAANDSTSFELSLRGGAEVGYRRFEDQELSGTPRTYQALPIPAVFFGVELVPRRDGWLAVEASLSQSVGLHSATDDALVGDPPASTARTLNTTFTRLDTAAKVRLFFDGAHDAYVAPLLGFSYSRYAFDGAPSGAEMPSGTYDVLCAGVEARATFATVRLFATAEYDELVAIGYLGQSRPASSGPGTTFRAGTTIPLWRSLSARFELSYTLWSYDMPRAVPALVTDQYATCRFGVETTF